MLVWYSEDENLPVVDDEDNINACVCKVAAVVQGRCNVYTNPEVLETVRLK